MDVIVGLQRTNTMQVTQNNFFGTDLDTEVTAQLNSSAQSKKQAKESSLHGRWTDEEHRLFIEGMTRFKKDWRSIERHIGTRTCSQIRSHAQKYFMRLEKKEIGEGDENSSKVSLTNNSNQGDELPLNALPRFQRMQSAAPALEAHSATKRPFKTDITQLE